MVLSSPNLQRDFIIHRYWLRKWFILFYFILLLFYLLFYLASSHLLNRCYFQKQDYICSKARQQVLKKITLAPTDTVSPTISTPEWWICHGWWTYIDTSSSSKVHSLHWASLLYILGFHRCIMTCIPFTVSYRVVFTTLGILCALFIVNKSFPCNSHWTLSCLHFCLYWNECCMAGIIIYIAFSDWLLFT